MWLALNRVMRSRSFVPVEGIGSGTGPSTFPDVLLTEQDNLFDVEPAGSSTKSVPMTRVWAMPNKWTFKIKPIREILEKYEVTNGNWIDPFAGFNSPAAVTNDLNPESPALYHMPAHEFLSELLAKQIADDDYGEGGSYDGVLFDPPYSIHQVKVAYDSFGLSLKDNITGGFPKEKDLIAQLVRPGGIVISFGWNTVGMGKKRGFEAVEYMAVSHGGNRNDTLVTVERKL